MDDITVGITFSLEDPTSMASPDKSFDSDRRGFSDPELYENESPQANTVLNHQISALEKELNKELLMKQGEAIYETSFI